MGFFKFVLAAFNGLKEPKTVGAAMTMLVTGGTGGYYLLEKVEAKHKAALTQISENRKKTTALLVVQEKVLAKLDAIKESVDDTKGQVEKTRDRIWQIGRDVYILKTKTN